MKEIVLNDILVWFIFKDKSHNKFFLNSNFKFVNSLIELNFRHEVRETQYYIFNIRIADKRSEEEDIVFAQHRIFLGCFTKVWKKI